MSVIRAKFNRVAPKISTNILYHACTTTSTQFVSSGTEEKTSMMVKQMLLVSLPRLVYCFVSRFVDRIVSNLEDSIAEIRYILAGDEADEIVILSLERNFCNTFNCWRQSELKCSDAPYYKKDRKRRFASLKSSCIQKAKYNFFWYRIKKAKNNFFWYCINFITKGFRCCDRGSKSIKICSS
jgi:hypothetical protein